MFTGIIEEIGTIRSIEKMQDGVRLSIEAQSVLQNTQIGDSIDIDGVCLTVTRCTDTHFTTEAVGETLTKTTLGEFRPGRRVNLERALTLQSRLGGHMVQGHVSGTGTIRNLVQRGENYLLEIELSPDLLQYCVREGSIAIDGISLTIARLRESHIGLSIIPETMKRTTLQFKKPGEAVNVEADIIARYVEKFLAGRTNLSLTPDKLKEWGY